MDQEIKYDLLIHCLSTETEEIGAARLEGLSGPDWDEVIQQSIRHGVAPILYNRFRTNTHIPDEVIQRLRTIYLQNVVRNTRLYNELSKVLKALKSEDIPVIILKGAALAEVVYQNIALRPMVDVDLLVKGKDIWRADRALRQLGYKSDMSSLLSRRHAQWVHHVVYRNGRLFIDVHPTRIHIELPDLDPWINASSVTIASTDVFILGAEDLLLHLCLHIGRHLIRNRFSRLIWWYDIRELLKHYREEINWDYVVQAAKKHEVQGAIHCVLHVVNEWFCEHVSADIISQFEDDGATISVNDVLDSFTRTIAKQVEDEGPDTFLLFMLRIPSIQGKIYHLFRGIFPSREFIAYHYLATKPSHVYFRYLNYMGEVVTRIVKGIYRLPGYLRSKYTSPRTRRFQ